MKNEVRSPWSYVGEATLKQVLKEWWLWFVVWVIGEVIGIVFGAAVDFVNPSQWTPNLPRPWSYVAFVAVFTFAMRGQTLKLSLPKAMHEWAIFNGAMVITALIGEYASSFVLTSWIWALMCIGAMLNNLEETGRDNVEARAAVWLSRAAQP